MTDNPEAFPQVRPTDKDAMITALKLMGLKVFTRFDVNGKRHLVRAERMDAHGVRSAVIGDPELTALAVFDNDGTLAQSLVLTGNLLSGDRLYQWEQIEKLWTRSVPAGGQFKTERKKKKSLEDVIPRLRPGRRKP